MEDKKTTFIVLMLIFSIFLVESPPMAKADGSVEAQDIWLQCNDNDYPDQWTGVDDGKDDIESTILGSLVNHTDLWGYQNDWDFNITQLRYGIEGGDNNEAGTAGAYEYIDYDNAGVLYGQISGTISQYDTWNTFTASAPISMPSGEDPQYFAVIWMDNEAGNFDMKFDNNPTNDGERVHKSLTYTGTYPNPLTGETGSIILDYWVRGFITAFMTNQTGFNQGYDVGNITEARRDIDIAFPSGTNAREIKVTLPRSEKLLNITYYNGGAWNESLSGSDYTLDAYYNATHMLITIPEATIVSYGEAYRIYSETYAYIFTMRGLFSENGTLEGSVNVTAHYLADSDEHELNGELPLYYDEDKPIQFTWSLSGGGSRRIYTYEGSYDIYIFTPDDTYSSYSFNIRDYTGAIGSGDTFLESLRVVNGTERVIERVLIWDTVNSVPLTLTIGQIYVLQVRLPDDSTYRFGYFTPGSDPTPTLTIRGIDFSDQAHYVGKDVSIDLTRPNYTHIQVEYQDDLTQTTSVFVEICYLNTTQVWNDTSTSDTVQFNWYNADSETDYLVNLIAEHEFYEMITSSAWLEGEKPGLAAMPDLSVLGAGFRYGLSILILLFIFSSGSTETRGIITSGTVAMAYLLRYIGWFPAPYVALHLSAFIVVAWMLGGNR